MIARLKPGVTLDQARAELDVLQHAVAQIAQRETKETVGLGSTIGPIVGIWLWTQMHQGFWLVAAAVGILSAVFPAIAAARIRSRNQWRIRRRRTE